MEKNITDAVQEICLWLRSPPGAQPLYVEGEPEYFYAPPYVGPKGWLGVDLDKGLDWLRVADLVREAYVEVAPESRLAGIADICLALPETSQDSQFGNPCFRAGKKNFCTLFFHQQRLQLSAWVGKEAQATLTFDERYTIPAYTGHNGWINLDIEDDLLVDEARMLIVDSYSHFALKRMLKALDEQSACVLPEN